MSQTSAAFWEWHGKAKYRFSFSKYLAETEVVGIFYVAKGFVLFINLNRENDSSFSIEAPSKTVFFRGSIVTLKLKQNISIL